MTSTRKHITASRCHCPLVVPLSNQAIDLSFVLNYMSTQLINKDTQNRILDYHETLLALVKEVANVFVVYFKVGKGYLEV